jgi:hypothetical protein
VVDNYRIKNQRRGKIEHEEALQGYINSVKSKGGKIIDLAGKSPDAIEVVIEDGNIKILAIEALPIRWNKGKNFWKKTYSHKAKRELYSMFDEIRIIEYKLAYSKPS